MLPHFSSAPFGAPTLRTFRAPFTFLVFAVNLFIEFLTLKESIHVRSESLLSSGMEQTNALEKRRRRWASCSNVRSLS